MFNLRCSLWFEQVPFPKDLYNEWKKFLSQKMKWWEKEFEQRAKCIIHFKDLSDDIRTHILHLLTNK